MTKIYLPRWISRCGALSRRAAEQAVADGRVMVDGRICRDVLRVVHAGRTQVTLDGAQVTPAEHVWIALHKRRGTVTTTADPESRPTVMLDLGKLAEVPGLAPVGRLDLDTQGLLLLTNDHVTAASLLDPLSHVSKVYHVKVGGHPTTEALKRLTHEHMVFGDVRLGPLQKAIEVRRNPDC